VKAVVIQLDGSVTSCRVLKSLPYLAEDVLATLKTQRYAPILYQGRACNVDYVFDLSFKLPPLKSRSVPPTDNPR
jgi:protein TonB